MSNILGKNLTRNSSFVTLMDCINEIPDPRINRMKKHPLDAIVLLALCAIIGGANTWVAIEEFGLVHYEWFKKILHLPHGIPSHDTINRVFLLLDSEALTVWFWVWLEKICTPDCKQISIDGKIVKAWKSKHPLTILRAWGSDCKLVLGQMKVPHATNEITAIPRLLDMIYIKGKIVTIDAIGTQKSIVTKIVARGGDYLLPVKSNQFHLFGDLKLFLDDLVSDKFHDVKYTYHETEDWGHGRHEIRRIWATEDVAWFDEKHLWAKLKSIAIVETARTIKEKTSVSRRYFITSLPADAQNILRYIRNHWGIENGPHWAMDLIFEEDRSTVRRGNGPQNFSLLRSLGFSLLKNESSKGSIRAKRCRASYQFNFLMKTLLNPRI